jgi:hypothetical protein
VNFDLLPRVSLSVLPAERKFHRIANSVPLSHGLQDDVKLQHFCLRSCEGSAKLLRFSCFPVCGQHLTHLEKKSKIIYVKLESIRTFLFLGAASCCVRCQAFIMVAVNRNEVFYLFSLFHSRHYMFRPVRAIFR